VAKLVGDLRGVRWYVQERSGRERGPFALREIERRLEAGGLLTLVSVVTGLVLGFGILFVGLMITGLVQLGRGWNRRPR